MAKIKVLQVPMLEEEWKNWRILCDGEQCSYRSHARDVLCDYMDAKMDRVKERIERERKGKEQIEADINEEGSGED